MKKEKYFNAVLALQTGKSLATISVRDISKQLNISTGALYYQFKSKDDLLNQMFITYKLKLRELTTNHEGDLRSYLQAYMEYNIEHNAEFRFTFSSELDSIISQEARDISHTTHLIIVEKLGLERPRDNHIITIVLGAMRSYLTAPSYFIQPDIDTFINELLHIIETAHN